MAARGVGVEETIGKEELGRGFVGAIAVEGLGLECDLMNTWEGWRRGGESGGYFIRTSVVSFVDRRPSSAMIGRRSISPPSPKL